MRTADIRAPDVWLRIISFCQQMGKHYRHIRFTATGNPPRDLVIPSAKALNLVMIVQEAVNNAAKHAGAGRVNVNSVVSGESWSLEIRDDGKGFVLKNAREKTDSHGMHTMQERALASGLTFTIHSADKKGTVIQLQLPVTSV